MGFLCHTHVFAHRQHFHCLDYTAHLLLGSRTPPAHATTRVRCRHACHWVSHYVPSMDRTDSCTCVSFSSCTVAVLRLHTAFFLVRLHGLHHRFLDLHTPGTPRTFSCTKDSFSFQTTSFLICRICHYHVRLFGHTGLTLHCTFFCIHGSGH